METKIENLIGKEGGKDGTFFAILAIEGTGETSVYPAFEDDGTPISPSGPKGMDYYLSHKKEVKRQTIRLIVSGNAVSAEAFVRTSTGCMASAIGPNTVDVFPGKKWIPDGECAASVLGSIKTEKKSATSRENGKKGGRPMKIENIQKKLIKAGF